MAIHGKKVNFDKVIKMVDDMVALLKKEQQDDEDKKEMCEMQLNKAKEALPLTSVSWTPSPSWRRMEPKLTPK